MAARERNYRCSVCGWQGAIESVDPGDAAPCPHCGVYVYPQSWFQTWGVVVLLVALTLGVVWAAVKLL